MGAMLERLPRNKRNIGLAVLAVLVLWFAWSIRSVINPLILGYMLAAIVVPIVRGLTRRGWSHRTAVVVVFASATLLTLIVAVGMAIQVRFLVADLVPSVAEHDAEAAAEQVEGEQVARSGGDRSSGDGSAGDGAADPGASTGSSTGGVEVSDGVTEFPRDGAPTGEGSTEGDGDAGDGQDAPGANAEEGTEQDAELVVDPDRPLSALLRNVNDWVFDATGTQLLSEEDRDELLALAAENESKLAGAGGRVAIGLWQRTQGALETIFGLSTLVLLVPLYAFFWMFEMDAMHAWIRRHIPVRERGRTTRMATQMGDILSRFFRGRLTICLVKGVLITVCLAIAGIPYSILLGMLAGLLSLVPFVGSVVAFALGAAVALGTRDPWWAALLITGAIYGAAELIEGYVLMPRILGESLGLSEVAVLFAVTAGGAALGLFGVLAALPLAAAVKVAFTEYVDPALTQWAEETSNRLADEQA